MNDPALADHAPEGIPQCVFGFAAFRPPRGTIIGTLTGGGDALPLMPGGGKSLC